VQKYSTIIYLKMFSRLPAVGRATDRSEKTEISFVGVVATFQRISSFIVSKYIDSLEK